MNSLLGRAALLALLTGMAACTPSAPEPAAMPATVKVRTLVHEDAELRVELPGRVVASQRAELRPQVDGIIARRLFEEGSVVQKGQPLYQIEDAALRASHEQAQARLQHAYAACGAARQSARRLADLAAVQAVSRQQLEQAEATHQQSEADIGVARANLESARVALAHARIVAPISGRIGRSQVTEGGLVTAHQADALATVHGLDPIHIDLVQSAVAALHLRRDIAHGRLADNRQWPVQIQLEDGSRLDRTGTLQFSDVSVDPATGTYGLRVRIANPDGVLLPGMLVTATLGDGVRASAVLVPMQSVQRDSRGQTQVMVVEASGQVARRTVRLGRALGDRCLVEEGLQAGERVIIEGLHKLQPGMQVQAVEAAAARSAAGAALAPLRGQAT